MKKFGPVSFSWGKTEGWVRINASFFTFNLINIIIVKTGGKNIALVAVGGRVLETKSENGFTLEATGRKFHFLLPGRTGR